MNPLAPLERLTHNGDRRSRRLGIDLDEPSSIRPDTDERFAGLSEEQHKRIPGKANWKAWMARDFPRDQWAVRRSNEGWRDSHVAAKPGQAGTAGAGTANTDIGSGDPSPPASSPHPAMPSGAGGGVPPTPPISALSGSAEDPVERAADEILATAAQAEPMVTPVVKAIADAAGATPARLESRLKTRESIIDKLTRPGKNLKETARDMNDALRYTLVTPTTTGYWKATGDAIGELERAGYAVVNNPGGWYKSGYRGLNLTIQSPEGQVFEVQIHTAESLRVAEASHELYEEQRRLPRGSERKREIRKLLRAIYDEVPWPPGVPRVQ